MIGCGDFSLGGEIWPGLSKLLEECGEVVQVGGKLIGSCGALDHWDGSNLKLRLEEELADLYAAIDFFVARNSLDAERICARAAQKEMQFLKWDGDPALEKPGAEQLPGSETPNSDAIANPPAIVSVPAARSDLSARGTALPVPETPPL